MVPYKTLYSEAGINMKTSLKTEKPDREDAIDVAIIGSGFAGLSAAIEAHNAGARVKVIEKADKPGGNSALSGGGIAAVGTERQSRAGIEDSVEEMSRDMITAGLGLNYPKLVRELAGQSNEALKWVEDYVGVKLRDRIDIFGGHSVPRCYTLEGWGAAVIEKMLAKLEELNIPIETSTKFRHFILDESGAVCGINVLSGTEAMLGAI